MRDPWRNYDKWKLASPEDEEDEQEQIRLRDEFEMEKADVMRDREKDDPRERG